MTIITTQVIVRGLVQGVGFRPFIYRMALKYGLNGWVQNTNENVRIRISGTAEQTSLFIASITNEKPPAATIESVVAEELNPEIFEEFAIFKSHDVSDDITEISPDIAVCDECLQDIEQHGNRLDYSFVNCTNCGPRFTIIRDLPYDRAKTTMQPFPMCRDCQTEYDIITDRRFHAQPTACVNCGPEYELFVGKNRVSTDIGFILTSVSEIIDEGGIAAIKGLGGMHLSCDAFNEAAIGKLRDLKNREAKPFAIMFRDLESVKHFAEVSQVEEQSLVSWRRPIVLLKLKRKLAENISSGLNLIGVMLPYLPFHYQLFKKLKTNAIVLTSGNLSSEPILIENAEALKQFSAFVDVVVLHNRDIYNRTDDSVVRIIGGKERVFRRSRGYVPTPVRMELDVNGIIAFGAELTNCFCVGKGRKSYISQHIGDLKGLETTVFYEQTLDQFIRLFRVKPALLAVDLHPDYISTRTAEKFRQLPVVQIQHHYAHIASCMAEHQLDEKVIGVAFDGTGYGSDGNIWGAEFMICDLLDFERVTYFDYVPLPGGDLANEEPWRMAVSYLYKVYGRDFLKMDLPILHQVEAEKIELIIRMIERNVNCPLTSSAGRLFDAVASILGICQVAAFPAQAPMLMESLAGVQPHTGADQKVLHHYDWQQEQCIQADNIIRGIVNDMLQGADNRIISTKFHNTIISVIFETVNTMRRSSGIQKVVLSGGVFQNKYLLEGTESLLSENKFQVYTHMAVPTNDGGIALGQMAVAAKRRESGCV